MWLMSGGVSVAFEADDAIRAVCRSLGGRVGGEVEPERVGRVGADGGLARWFAWSAACDGLSPRLVEKGCSCCEPWSWSRCWAFWWRWR